MFSTRKERLWFVIWCVWAIGWFLAYFFGTFYELGQNEFGPKEITLANYIDQFKFDGLFITEIVLPAIALGGYLGISKIRGWIGGGQ